jgi:hypothetical protein
VQQRRRLFLSGRIQEKALEQDSARNGTLDEIKDLLREQPKLAAANF